MHKKLTVFFHLIALSLALPAGAQAPGSKVSSEDACWTLLNARDWARATSAGQRAVSANPTRDAHLCLGRAYKETGTLELALAEFKETERLSATDDELQTISNWLGATASSMGDLEGAELYSSRALMLARRGKNKVKEAIELNNLGGIYKSRGLYDKSLKFYREAVQLQDNEEEKATVYGNIGVVYADAHRPREAISWLSKAIAIEERSGAYGRVARSRLNLGSAYRQLGDLVRAEKSLADGLAAAIKGGDQYWQAVGYQYQADLKAEQKHLDAARELYAQAADLATRLGAEVLARNNRVERDRILHAQVARTFTGIEIGAKGVKALSVELKEPLEGGFTYSERFRRTENTDLMSATVNGAARPAAVEATARAVANFVRALQKEANIPAKDIYIRGSSAAARATNRAVLAERVKQLSGTSMEFVSAGQEAHGAFLGAVPANAFKSGVAIDVGSGNTKISYRFPKDGSVAFATIDIPFGTVSLTEAANASRRPNEDFAHALDRFVAEKVRPDLVRRLKLFPVLAQRNDFYWVGGTVWAFASLTQVQDTSTGLLKFSPDDVKKLGRALRKNPELALNPSLDAIVDPGIKERAGKQLSAVRAAFSAENVMAGTKLLELLTSELHVQGKHSTFNRYGGWLLGLLYSKS